MIDWSYTLGWDTREKGLLLPGRRWVFPNTLRMGHESYGGPYRSYVCLDVAI